MGLKYGGRKGCNLLLKVEYSPTFWLGPQFFIFGENRNWRGIGWYMHIYTTDISVWVIGEG